MTDYDRDAVRIALILIALFIAAAVIFGNVDPTVRQELRQPSPSAAGQVSDAPRPHPSTLHLTGVGAG